MSTHLTDEKLFQSWEATPEPSLPASDPQTIVDGNLDETAWMYNSENEETEWLTFSGETMPLIQ